MLFHNPARYSPAELLHDIAHRPFPIPQKRWVLAQTWQRLLFAHWPVPVDVLRPLIPPTLTIDTYDGTAWVGVVPFRMNGVRLRGLPPLPYSATFPELNVRTYVTHGGIGAVWFFSLDAGSQMVVMTARRWFHLPYYHAEMAIETHDDHTHYHSRRTHRGARPAAFVAPYRPIAAVQHYAPDSLERWLTERYALFAADNRGRIYRAAIHHLPWPLQPAEAQFEQNSMAQASGITLPDSAPLLHYAHHLDVLAWPLEMVQE